MNLEGLIKEIENILDVSGSLSVFGKILVRVGRIGLRNEEISDRMWFVFNNFASIGESVEFDYGEEANEENTELVKRDLWKIIDSTDSKKKKLLLKTKIDQDVANLIKREKERRNIS